MTKHDKHVDRVVRFRRTIDGDVPDAPETNERFCQDLVMVPLCFAFPDGGVAIHTPPPPPADLADMQVLLPILGDGPYNTGHAAPPAIGYDLTLAAGEPGTVDSATMVGGPGVTYDVTIHIEGIIEDDSYSGGSFAPLASGFVSGTGNGPGRPYVGGSVIAGYERSASYRLTVSDPSTVYFLYRHPTGGFVDAWHANYDIIIPITTGATVTLEAIPGVFASGVPGDNLMPGDPVCKLNSVGTIGVGDPVEPFDGQFLNVTFVSATPQ